VRLSEAIEQNIMQKRTAGLKYQTEESTLTTLLKLLGDVPLSE